jgi:hypothetical protein
MSVDWLWQNAAWQLILVLLTALVTALVTRWETRWKTTWSKPIVNGTVVGAALMVLFVGTKVVLYLNAVEAEEHKRRSQITTEENIADKIAHWTTRLGYRLQRSPASGGAFLFEITPPDGVRVRVQRTATAPHYLELITTLQMGAMKEPQARLIFQDITRELARLKGEWMFKPRNELLLRRSMPIAPTLDEDRFIVGMNDLTVMLIVANSVVCQHAFKPRCDVQVSTPNELLSR